MSDNPLQITAFAGININDNQNLTNPGSLIEAIDVVCDKPGVIEANRSFAAFRNPVSNNIDSAYNYIDPATNHETMVIHTLSDNKMYYSDPLGPGPSFNVKSGSYTVPTGATAIRAVNENKSLYFTEQNGIKVMDSLAGSIIDAGIPRSLDPQVNVTGQYAFTNGDISQNSTAGAGDVSSVSCIDSQGNKYIAFTGEIAGGYILQKYDSSGNLLFRVGNNYPTILSATEAVKYVTSIRVDSTDNVYIGGIFDSTASGSVNGRFITGAIAGNNPFIVRYNSSGVLQWTCVFASTTANVTLSYFTKIYVDNRSGFDQVYIGLNGNNPSLAVATWTPNYNVTSTTGTGSSLGSFNRNCPILIGLTTTGTLFFTSTSYALASATFAGVPINSIAGFVLNGTLTLGLSTSTTGLVTHTFNGQTIPTNNLIVYRLLINGAAPATARILTYAQNRNIYISHIDISDGTTDTVFFASRTVTTAQIVSFTSVAVATATPAALTNINAEISITATCQTATDSQSLNFNHTTNALYFSCNTSNGVNGSSALGLRDFYVILYGFNGSAWTALKTQQYGGTNLYTNQSAPQVVTQNLYIRPSDGFTVIGGIVSNFGTAAAGLYGKPFISTATNSNTGDYYSINIDPSQLTVQNVIEYGGTSTTASTIYIGAHTFVANDAITFYSTGTLPTPLVQGRQYIVGSVTSASITVVGSIGGSAIQIFPITSTDIHYVRYVSQPSASYTNGFLGNLKEVRYRAIIGRIDNNNYLKLGSPSGESFQVPNLYPRSSTVNVRVYIPSGLDTTYFVEIYRSLQTTFPTSPNDELYFAQKLQLTGTNISNGYVDFVDTTAEANLGATLYTSPSQETILQENDQPPISTDIAFYKGLTLYSNTKYKNRLVFTFSWKNITDGTNLALTNTYNILRVTWNVSSTFDVYMASLVSTLPTGNFYYENNGDPTYCAYRSALNMVQMINSLAANTILRAYLINVDGSNASILLESISPSQSFTISTPYTFSNYPLIIYDTASSSQDANTNRILVSKSQQPDAVPLANFYDVGPAGSTIKRIIPMRNSIFVLSDAGTYQILGDTLDQFQTNNYNLEMKILPLADSSAVVLDNILYFLSNNWVVACNESSFDMIGKPIQPLLEIGYSNAGIGISGLADKTNNRYLLFLAGGTQSTVNYHRIYVYSTYTNQWVEWSKAASCGVIVNDDLYICADPSSSGLSTTQAYNQLSNFVISDYATSACSLKLKMINVDDFSINKQFMFLYLQFQNPYPGDLTLEVTTDMDGVDSTPFTKTIQTQNTSGTWNYSSVVPGILMTDLNGIVGREMYVSITIPNGQNLTLSGAWVDWSPYGTNSL